MTIILGPGEQRQLNVALLPAPLNATLFGYITDAESGGPIAGALVELSGGYSATTNSQGYYQILNIPPGSYEGQVSAAGYELSTF
jgi:protocatechuate 3,4-dioxygenase beta subunit